MEASKHKARGFISAAAAIIILYTIFHIVGIGCPIKFLTGISCPGCGMTRAWFAALHMDLVSAFGYHPLFLLPVPAVMVYLFRSKISHGKYKTLILTFVLIFLIIYICRIFDSSDDIAVFEPQNGFIYRLITNIFKR